MANENNKIEDIIRASLENMRTMVDANTVIGDPYTTPSGTTVIPVSKISVGFATGGLDFQSKRPISPTNFGGGSGTGVAITPVAFLTVGANAEINLIEIGNGSDSIERAIGLIESSPEIISKIKSSFFS